MQEFRLHAFLLVLDLAMMATSQLLPDQYEALAWVLLFSSLGGLVFLSAWFLYDWLGMRRRKRRLARAKPRRPQDTEVASLIGKCFAIMREAEVGAIKLDDPKIAAVADSDHAVWVLPGTDDARWKFLDAVGEVVQGRQANIMFAPEKHAELKNKMKAAFNHLDNALVEARY